MAQLWGWEYEQLCILPLPSPPGNPGLGAGGARGNHRMMWESLGPQHRAAGSHPQPSCPESAL